MTYLQVIGFFALCLLSSTSWLTTDLFPLTNSSAAGAGCRLLLVGMTGLAIYLLQPGSAKFPSIARSAAVGIASLGMIGIPFLLVAGAAGKIASTGAVLVFAGMSILMTVVNASSSTNSGLRPLPFGLLGLGGLLVLLPFQMPRGDSGILALSMLLLAMVCTATCLIWLHRLLVGFSFAIALSLAGFMNGILLVSVSFSAMPHWDLHGTGSELLRCLLFNLPETMLLIWLTRVVTPLRLSALYLVAPLLTVIEGLLLMRPRLEGRTLFGMTLLGIGAYGILRGNVASHETHLELG